MHLRNPFLPPLPPPLPSWQAKHNHAGAKTNGKLKRAAPLGLGGMPSKLSKKSRRTRASALKPTTAKGGSSKEAGDLRARVSALRAVLLREGPLSGEAKAKRDGELETATYIE